MRHIIDFDASFNQAGLTRHCLGDFIPKILLVQLFGES